MIKLPLKERYRKALWEIDGEGRAVLILPAGIGMKTISELEEAGLIERIGDHSLHGAQYRRTAAGEEIASKDYMLQGKRDLSDPS
jgi:hypothetical protein